MPLKFEKWGVIFAKFREGDVFLNRRYSNVAYKGIQMHVFESKRSICQYLYIYYSFSSLINNCLYGFLETRGEFGDPENQYFLRNRGLFKVKVSEKGGGGNREGTNGSH